MKPKETLLILGSVTMIAASALFLWNNLFAAPKVNVALHQGVGEALAEETLRCLNNRGEILVITLADADSDILAAQFAAFRARIGKSSARIKDVVLIDSEKKDKYAPGLGLSARKLERELKKHGRKDALVSFVGLPNVDEAELAALGAPVPPLLAFSRDPSKLGALLERGMVKAAIVPRFSFPAPGPDSPRTPAEWFTNQYQVLVPIVKVVGN